MDDDYSYVDPAARLYFDLFVIEAQNRGINLDYSRVKIGFVSLSGNTAGETDFKRNRILIDSTSGLWRASPEILVFHELGHLILNRDHVQGHPSIMNPGGIIVTFYYADRDKYVDELFNVVN